MLQRLRGEAQDRDDKILEDQAAANPVVKASAEETAEEGAA